MFHDLHWPCWTQKRRHPGLPVHLGRPLPNASLTPQLPERSSGLTLSCLHDSRRREPRPAVPGRSPPSAWLLWNPIPWLTSDLTFKTIHVLSSPSSWSIISKIPHILNSSFDDPFASCFNRNLAFLWGPCFRSDPLRELAVSLLPHPCVTKSASGRAASHHWSHLPLLLRPARPHQPLRSRLTTPYFLTAVILRPSGFPPLLIQSHAFSTWPSSFLRFHDLRWWFFYYAGTF